jgi:hypothetical protein
MKTVIITSEDLSQLHCCEPQVRRFARLFPKGLPITEAGFMKLFDSWTAKGTTGRLNASDEGWQIGYFADSILHLIDDKTLCEYWVLEMGSSEHKDFLLKWFKANKEAICARINLLRKEDQKKKYDKIFTAIQRFMKWDYSFWFIVGLLPLGMIVYCILCYTKVI